MKKQTTRRQRIIRALTPRRVQRMQAKWRRRKQRITKTRDKVRGIWHGEPVVNGRRKTKTTAPRQRRKPPVQPRGRQHKPKTVELPERPPCDGTCTNSDTGPDEARAQGLCGTCGGRKEIVTKWRGKCIHKSCQECDGSGLDSVAQLRAKRKKAAEKRDDPRKPSKAEAGRTAAVWCCLGSVAFAVVTVFGGGLVMFLVGLTCLAIGGASYLHERKHGASGHGARSARDAAKKAAREAGCSAACMWSRKPVDTCHCPCGGATHGMALKRKAAA